MALNAPEGKGEGPLGRSPILRLDRNTFPPEIMRKWGGFRDQRWICLCLHEGGTPVCQLPLTTQRRRWHFSSRPAGPLNKLSFAECVEKSAPRGSGHSQVATKRRALSSVAAIRFNSHPSSTTGTGFGSASAWPSNPRPGIPPAGVDRIVWVMLFQPLRWHLVRLFTAQRRMYPRRIAGLAIGPGGAACRRIR